MFEKKEIEKKKAILVGTYKRNLEAEQESLKELAFLAKTADIEVVETVLQKKDVIDAAFYIGKGKVAEVARMLKALEADVVIFDNELKPLQIRNIEKECKVPIIDRTELILHIFALRARSKQAKLQVESAQLKYEMPRLKGMWTHFTKIEGGIGMKGLGETQLELDRRMTRKRIQKIDKQLKDFEKRRHIERHGREGFFKVSIVGYTNAGKSTLLNILSDSDVFAEDRLFATLDATTRKVDLDNNKSFLLTDTVGFINKLPHNLVASFHATLDEINYADLLLIVVDAAHPLFKKHLEVVNDTLKEIKCDNDNRIIVFNKIDLFKEKDELLQLTEDSSLDKKDLLIKLLKRTYGEDIVAVSAKTGEGLNDLKELIASAMNKLNKYVCVKVSAGNGKAISYIKSNTTIIEEGYEEDLFVCSLEVSEDVVVELERIGCEVTDL